MKKILLITTSFILVVIAIFSIILCFVNNDLFKLIKYTQSNYNLNISDIIDDESDSQFVYYRSCIKKITNNLTQEESIDIINNYNNQKVNLLDKYSIIFRYSKYISVGKSDNSNSNNSINYFDNDFLINAIELIYDLDTRLDVYTDVQLITFNNHLNEILNYSNTSDVSLVKLRDFSNFIGELSYDLKNFNFILSYLLNIDVLEHSDDLTLLITSYLKELNSDDVLSLIDILREDTEEIVVYFINLIYNKSVIFNQANIYNQIELLLEYYEIDYEYNIFDLSIYLFNNDITKYQNINDELTKSKIDSIVDIINDYTK